MAKNKFWGYYNRIETISSPCNSINLLDSTNMLIHDIELIKSLNLNNLYTFKQIVQIDLNSIEPFIKYPFSADSNLCLSYSYLIKSTFIN